MLGKCTPLTPLLLAATLLILPGQQGLAQSTSQAQSQTESQQPHESTPESALSSQAASQYTVLHVSPDAGSDQAGSGAQHQPFKTITHAIQVAQSNTVIVLAPGRYTADTGESFPLRLKPGITIQGSPDAENSAIIQGGGSFDSPTLSQQNVAIVAADRSGMAHVVVSNPNPQGHGVWIESGSPIIRETAFVANRHTGLYLAGGSPVIEASYFFQNQVAGLVIYGSSRAVVRGNHFEATGTAITVASEATPEIAHNQIIRNEEGILLLGNASPVFVSNTIAENRRNGVVEVATAAPVGLPAATPQVVTSAAPAPTSIVPPSSATEAAPAPASAEPPRSAEAAAPAPDSPTSPPSVEVEAPAPASVAPTSSVTEKVPTESESEITPEITPESLAPSNTATAADLALNGASAIALTSPPPTAPPIAPVVEQVVGTDETLAPVRVPSLDASDESIPEANIEAETAAEAAEEISENPNEVEVVEIPETVPPPLAEADLDEADLDEADLDEADLDEADLDEADLDEADLDEADLDEADLDEAEPSSEVESADDGEASRSTSEARPSIADLRNRLTGGVTALSPATSSAPSRASSSPPSIEISVIGPDSTSARDEADEDLVERSGRDEDSDRDEDSGRNEGSDRDEDAEALAEPEETRRLPRVPVAAALATPPLPTPDEAALPSLPTSDGSRLLVPGPNIPIGSGGDSNAAFALSAVGAASHSPPPPPLSRATALGLHYRVYVAGQDAETQARLREVVPDAFRSQFEGQPVMQAGAYPDEEEAEERLELLLDHDFEAWIEHTP
ncbi:MAG: DUF1565 domain-containing protein [Cyanobacteria bacterium P01_D01_bin.44]